MKSAPRRPFTPPEPNSIDPELIGDLVMLKEMAELAMDLVRLYAEKAHEQAAAEEAYAQAVEDAEPEAALPEPPVFRDFGAMFGRAARTARQAIALKTRLREGYFAVREKIEREQEQRRNAAEALEETEKAKRVELALEIAGASLNAAINAEGRDLASVMTDLHERLNDNEAYEELAGQSTILLARRLCKDLGIKPVWGTDPRFPYRSPAIGDDDDSEDEDDDPEDSGTEDGNPEDGTTAEEEPGQVPADDGVDTG